MQFTNGTVILNRTQVVEALKLRDGDYCRYPDCKHPHKFTNADPRTIDHWIARANGGTDDLENLRLMHRSCNNLKGDRQWIIDADGNEALTPLPSREPKSKIVKREPCDTCFEGHILKVGEVCPDCGSGPQPLAFPAVLKRTPKECNHSSTHCWACVIGIYERTPASADVFGVD